MVEVGSNNELEVVEMSILGMAAEETCKQVVVGEGVIEADDTELVKVVVVSS